jgi:hypothetical protein
MALLAGVVLALPLALVMAWIADTIDGALRLRRRYGCWTAVLEQSLSGAAR